MKYEFLERRLRLAPYLLTMCLVLSGCNFIRSLFSEAKGSQSYTACLYDKQVKNCVSELIEAGVRIDKSYRVPGGKVNRYDIGSFLYDGRADLDVLELIFKKGGLNPNFEDEFGRTPLLNLTNIECGDPIPEKIRFLRKIGADPLKKNSKNVSAVDYAIAARLKGCLAALTDDSEYKPTQLHREMVAAIGVLAATGKNEPLVAKMKSFGKYFNERFGGGVVDLDKLKPALSELHRIESYDSDRMELEWKEDEQLGEKK